MQYCLLNAAYINFTYENLVNHQSPYPKDRLVWLEEQSDIYV